MMIRSMMIRSMPAAMSQPIIALIPVALNHPPEPSPSRHYTVTTSTTMNETIQR